jgi:hypothetical protein
MPAFVRLSYSRKKMRAIALLMLRLKSVSKIVYLNTKLPSSDFGSLIKTSLRVKMYLRILRLTRNRRY